jgi:hypothetical protein
MEERLEQLLSELRFFIARKGLFLGEFRYVGFNAWFSLYTPIEDNAIQLIDIVLFDIAEETFRGGEVISPKSMHYVTKIDISDEEIAGRKLASIAIERQGEYRIYFSGIAFHVRTKPVDKLA